MISSQDYRFFLLFQSWRSGISLIQSLQLPDMAGAVSIFVRCIPTMLLMILMSGLRFSQGCVLHTHLGSDCTSSALSSITQDPVPIFSRVLYADNISRMTPLMLRRTRIFGHQCPF